MPRLVAIAVVLTGCALAHEPTGLPDADRPSDTGVPRDAPRTPRWEVSTLVPRVGDAGTSGRNPVLVIDAEGTLHITHLRDDRGEVLYTHGRPGDVVTEVIERFRPSIFTGPVGAAQLVVAPSGIVHVAIAHGNRSPVAAWQRDLDGTWTTSVLPYEPAEDGTRQPAIAWLDGGPRFVGVGPIEAGGASRPVLVGDDVIGSTREWPGLWLRAVGLEDGRLAVLFHDGEQRLALGSLGSSWVTHTLGTEPVAAMDADRAGTLHLVWKDVGPGDASILHVGALRGGVIVSEATTTLPGFVQRLDIASDGETVHLALETPGEVFYGRVVGAGIETTSLGVVNPQNGRPTIDLDPDGAPWIAYRDRLGALVVATLR